MNVERQVRRARWLMAFWRVVVSVLEVPERVIRAVVTLLHAFADFFAALARIAFTMELDAARRYYALTGLDLAAANGEDDRYRMIRIVAGDEEPVEVGEDFDGEAL